MLGVQDSFFACGVPVLFGCYLLLLVFPCVLFGLLVLPL
jgi:hypothetical protein